jgi:hypothetical protein
LWPPSFEGLARSLFDLQPQLSIPAIQVPQNAFD